MLHGACHKISYEYDGNFELSNISKIFSQVNKDNSIGKIGNKIINFEDYNAQTIGIILLWVSAFLTLYTGYGYLIKGIDHAISEDSKN